MDIETTRKEWEGAADPGVRAAWHLFRYSGLYEFKRQDVARFFEPHHRLAVEELLEAAAPWSHSERLLVKCMASLFNRHEGAEVHLCDLVNTLDDRNFGAVVDAMGVYRGREVFRWSEQQDPTSWDDRGAT